MVYAITFAHSQDDNWGWCEAINEALLRLTQRHPGQPIDLLGHSKGGLAARLAVTDWRPDPICSRFLGELVGRVVLLGSPNEGLDYAFRYPACNLALLTNEEHPHLNWSVSWTNRLVEGTWQDCEELSYFATEPYQPGQRQMLARWDRQYPLPGKDPDESSTYEGGQGTRSSSLGIDIAIERGGDLIQQLKSRPTHPDVPVGLLAGARPTIKGFLNDTSIPGDGIIPIQSALGLPEASKVVAMATLPIDHIALITDPIAQAIVVEMLTIEPTALSPDQRLSALEEGLSIARSRSGL